MALDGLYLHKICEELNVLSEGRVDKITQPSRDSIVIAMRSGGKNRKMFISAEAAGSKILLTKEKLESPMQAPNFCMLLRKYLNGAKLLRVEQRGLDRIAELVFEGINDFGDHVEIRLIAEIMGRRSNIILVNADGKIIDAIKRVDFVTSQVRQVLSGINYCYPPKEDKLLITEKSPEEIAEKIVLGKSLPLSKGIMDVLEGFSPFMAREVSSFATKGADTLTDMLTVEERKRLEFYLGVVKSAMLKGEGKPTIVKNPEGKKVEFGIIAPQQYPENWERVECESFSAALEEFYSGNDLKESMRQKSADLNKQLGTILDRTRRKLAIRKNEQQDSTNREEKKMFGDIISSNLYKMKKGDKELVTENFYAEGMPLVTIPLDESLTPAQNAQKYYSEYRKAANAEEKLKELIKATEDEIIYLESVISNLEKAECDAEIADIREELAQGGYIRLRPQKGMKPKKLAPKKYISSDGFIIYSGRNNIQNDKLTLKDSRNYDLWLHTQKIPGSHTVIVSKGQEGFPNRTIEEAAIIAAVNSSASESTKVPVDYTIIKNVKKPNGAKPGMVIYETYNTAIINPDKELAKRLEVKNN